MKNRPALSSSLCGVFFLFIGFITGCGIDIPNPLDTSEEHSKNKKHPSVDSSSIATQTATTTAPPVSASTEEEVKEQLFDGSYALVFRGLDAEPESLLTATLQLKNRTGTLTSNPSSSEWQITGTVTINDTGDLKGTLTLEKQKKSHAIILEKTKIHEHRIQGSYGMNSLTNSSVAGNLNGVLMGTPEVLKSSLKTWNRQFDGMYRFEFKSSTTTLTSICVEVRQGLIEPQKNPEWLFYGAFEVNGSFLLVSDSKSKYQFLGEGALLSNESIAGGYQLFSPETSSGVIEGLRVTECH